MNLTLHAKLSIGIAGLAILAGVVYVSGFLGSGLNRRNVIAYPLETGPLPNSEKPSPSKPLVISSFEGASEEAAQTRHEMLALGESSLENALAYIEAHYPVEERESAREFLMLEISKRRIETIPEIMRILGPSQRGRVLSRAIQHWLQKDIYALLRVADKLPTGYLSNRIHGDAAVYLAEQGKLDEAMDRIREMPFSTFRTQAIGNIAGTFRGTAKEGVEWSSKLDLSEEVRAAQSMLIAHFRTTQDLDGLRGLIENRDFLTNLKLNAAHHLGKLAGEMGAAEVSKQLSKSNFSQQFHDMLIVGGMSTCSDADLLPLFNSVLASPEFATRETATRSFVNRAFASDQQRAIAWVKNAPSELRSAAIETLVNGWYNSDSIALSEWIQTLPVGKDRDTALLKLADLLRDSDPVAAKQVADSISDSNDRSSILRTLK